MRKTWKKLGLLAALCGTAVLFACAKPPAAPENTPHLVQQAQTMGCTDFLEIGPKPVLKSLVRSIAKGMTASYGFR